MFKKWKKAEKTEQDGQRPMKVLRYVIAALVALVLFFFGFTCVVREGSCSVILRLGAVRKEVTQAGLYLKLPWPFENVVTYDSRLQYLMSNRLETTTRDKRNISLQSYVVWQVQDPVLYHNSVGVSNAAETYINDQVFSATNSTLGAYDLKSLVSTDQDTIRIDEIQQEIFQRVRDNCEENYGIRVVDVSIMTLSLPANNLNSIFEQMSADRQKDIDTILADARKQANKIETDADAEAARIRAEGVTKAAEINAKAETEVAKIYAQAQAANIDLYKFLKELDTISASVGDSTVLVVKADEYPFSVLTKYAATLSPGSSDTVVQDLSYILSQLEPEDRTELVRAISQLLVRQAEGPGEAE